MRVYLDDVRKMPEEYDVLVKSAGEAIELLKTGKVTEISLDFDLGIGVETGYAVAKWIEENAVSGQLDKIRVRLHTLSYDGKLMMQECLRNSHRAWMDR